MKFHCLNSIKNLFKPVDLTTGKPYKQLLIFMLPILISYVFQQVYTISDAAIVGKYLSAPEVSGVNVVYSLILSFYNLPLAVQVALVSFLVIMLVKRMRKELENHLLPKSFFH